MAPAIAWRARSIFAILSSRLARKLIAPGLFVAQGQIILNGGDQLPYAGETAVADGVICYVREEALDQVEPGTARRG